MITEQTSFKTDIKTLVMIVLDLSAFVYLPLINLVPSMLQKFQVEKLTIRVDDMMHNKVMIGSIDKDLDKALNDIEKLKDSVRANIGKLNGDH